MKLPTTPRLDPQTPQELVRLLRDMATQVNGISEGTMYAVHNAAATVPTTGSFAKGDFVRKFEPSEAGSSGSKYIIYGWVCTVSGTPGTWVPLWIPTEAWSGGGSGVTSPGCATNWAVGTGALSGGSLTGCWNTAYGTNTLKTNTTGVSNSAFGDYALRDNTTGSWNIAIGFESLLLNTTGSNNIGIGLSAAYSLTGAGSYSNIAIGTAAMQNAYSGFRNVVVGVDAAQDINGSNNNTILGYGTGNGITTGSGNLILGYGITGLSSTLTNHIVLGSGATIRARFDGTSWTMTGNKVNITTAKTPASATDTGVAGDVCWDTGYLYVCTATNTWKRTALTTW